MKKINVEKIIAVSGMPGLYKIVSNGVKGVIVENITDKKRTIVLNNSKIYSLDSIRIFVNDGEQPVGEALFNLHQSLNGAVAPHHKTSADEEIISVFEKAIPDYDKEKVNINNMRKLMQWYNLLHQAGLLNVIEETNDENIENTSVSENKETSITSEPAAKTSSEKTSKKQKAEAEVNTDTEPAPKKRGRKKKSENE